MSMNPNLNMDWTNNSDLTESDLMGISENCGYDILIGANNGEDVRRAYGSFPWPNDQEINSIEPEDEEGGDDPEPEPEPEDKYLTFTALEDSSIGLKFHKNYEALMDRCNFEYSVDNGKTWNGYSWDSDSEGSMISLNNGDKIKFRGTNPGLSKYNQCGSSYHNFKMTGRLSASGDVTSLLNNEGGDASFAGEYIGMMNLFENCTSLVETPSLPSTELTVYCYQNMFKGCTGLTSIPSDLLPATTLSNNCYNNMFSGCTGLFNIPSDLLPATTLSNYCYYNMFQGCTSLTTAPDLRSIALSDGCYGGMFSGCTSLTSIKCVASDISAYGCTNNWVAEVSNSGTFTKKLGVDWTTGVSGIPEGWTVEEEM